MSASGLREGPDTQIAPHTFASSRDATVAVRRFPLVIISRGGGGVPPLYRTIATHLAANGFVVVAPEHAGNNQRENTLRNTHDTVVRRVRHRSLTIDAVLADPPLGSHIDAGNTAALGHSIGGTAALALAGGVSVSQPLSQRGRPQRGANRSDSGAEHDPKTAIPTHLSGEAQCPGHTPQREHPDRDRLPRCGAAPYNRA
jgi:predicted dienelactone hydrolase